MTKIDQLPPAKSARVHISQLSSVADVIRADLKKFRFSANQLTRSMVNIGFCLVYVRDSLPHGKWGVWLEENVPELSRRQAYYCIQTAEKCAEEIALPEKKTLLLGSGKETAATKQSLKSVLDFIGEDSPMELMERLGIRSKEPKKLGGNHELQLWLKEKYPQLAGADVKLADLPDDVRADWDEHVKSLRRHMALEARNAENRIWEKLIDELEGRGLKAKSWSRLPKARIERLQGVLIDLGALIREAMKS